MIKIFKTVFLDGDNRKRMEELSRLIGQNTAARVMAEMQLSAIQRRIEKEDGIKAKKRLKVIEKKKIEEIARLTHELNEMKREERILSKKLNNLYDELER